MVSRLLKGIALMAVAVAGRPEPAAHPLLKLKGHEEVAFKSFMATHEYTFEGAEYGKRLEIFTDNIAAAIERNTKDPTAEHGITKFSHLTSEEFAASYLGRPVDPVEYRKSMPMGAALPLKDIPDDFDWRTKGAVTNVKNQGQCGSCWSFSATGAIEGATMIKKGTLPVLSEQMLVDCDHQCYNDDPTNGCDAGCNGGLPANAMEWIMKNGGIDSEESYPYEAVDGQCRKDKGKVVAAVGNYTLVPTDEEQMKQYLYKYGPLSIGIDALWMQSYVKGVSCPWICNPAALDHGVLIVGYGAKGFTPTHLSENPFWTIKNSWGPSWGEDGYIRMCRGKNMCGLNEMVVSVTDV